MNCPLCNKAEQSVIYTASDVPAFQNKVYEDMASLEASPSFSVELLRCHSCGFAWNSKFQSEAMEYDDSYQNEQGHSPSFRRHLERTLDLVASIVRPGQRIIEVGCGKGVFLAMMRNADFSVTGYDPSHEAGDPDVVKTYFDKSLEVDPGELVVLRHTLEHVPAPLDFLSAISEANGRQGRILIEVPRFEWILENKAFWDIFHEHCNYFTEQSLANLFENAEVIPCFEGQYMWVIADLKDFKGTSVTGGLDLPRVDDRLFATEIGRFKEFVSKHRGCWVWGAGAKGVAFVNQVDPDARFVQGLIDINPVKQGRFVAKTGHRIFSPEEFRNSEAGEIIIMNDNYKDEIQGMCAGSGSTLLTMGEI